MREEILHLCDFFDNQTNHSPSSQSSHCCCNDTRCVMGTGEFVCGNLLVFCKLFFNTVIIMVSFMMCLSYRIARRLRELSVALLVARFGFLPNVISLFETLHLLPNAYLLVGDLSTAGFHLRGSEGGHLPPPWKLD